MEPCCAPRKEFETQFSSALLAMFSPHSKASGAKKSDSIIGWETCDDLHEDELLPQCAANRPYASLQLMQMSLNDNDDSTGEMLSRPTSVNGEIKRKNKTVSAMNIAIRRSKSSRCLQSGNPSTPVRNWGSSFHPGIRYDSRFPMLYHGIREIKYDFRPFGHHQQHADAYRNSYTYTLIRNFRELRATGLIGHKCHTALKFTMSSPSKEKKLRGNSRRTPQRKKRGSNSLNQSPVVYYTDQCQTGPVVNLHGTKIGPKAADFISSAGTCFLPKSTMEINAVTLRPSQQRPFGEQDLQNKLEQAALKSTHLKTSPSDLFCLKRKSNNGSIGIVAGTSALSQSHSSLASSRKVSPLGKVPVAIRRSSPSIRGKRDPVTGLEGVNRFLSIAVATHTVASPYHTGTSRSKEDLSINADL